MWKRIGIGVALSIAVLGSLAWFNRNAIILYLARSSDMEVAKNRPVAWMKGPDSATQDPASRPPNIIFILADDLGINDISTFGGGVAGGRVPTPNIDRLAAEGAVFSQAYSGTATCAPSRAMLLTGRYPTRTGFEYTPTPPNMTNVLSLIMPREHENYGMPAVSYNEDAAEAGVDFADMGLPPEEVTIAEVLGAHGYHAVHIGKWHLGRSEKFRAVNQGFDESLLMASGLYLPIDDPQAVNAPVDSDTFDKFLWAQMRFAADYDRAGEKAQDQYFEPTKYIMDYYTDEALNVIEANRNRPFFLYLAHWGVHNPLQATREDYEALSDIEPHRLRVYAAMVRAIDRSVGRLMEKLEDEGLAENTVIVFSSDNGGAGYIGLPDINAPYRGWKTTMFEGGIRVPMFVRWPGRIAPGTAIDEPVAHVDVMPSLAAIAGAPMPKNVTIDGRNAFALATGADEDFSRPDGALFWSSGFYRVVRAGNWKLHVNARQNRKWLFDLAKDPTEEINLAARNPAKLKELENLMAAHWAEAREPLYPYTMAFPVRIDRTGAEPFSRDDEYIVWPN